MHPGSHALGTAEELLQIKPNPADLRLQNDSIHKCSGHAASHLFCDSEFRQPSLRLDVIEYPLNQFDDIVRRLAGFPQPNHKERISALLFRLWGRERFAE